MDRVTKPFSFTTPEYVQKMKLQEVKACFVAILGHNIPDRNMKLSPYQTRCIRKGEIHELVHVRENEEKVIDINHGWYLGFVEFEKGVVLAKGFKIMINNKSFGQVVGFDENHAPNHLNIIISTSTPQIGTESGINIGDPCYFLPD